MNRFHKISAIVCALLSSHVYGAPASLDGLIPVAFSQFRSNMPDEKASRIVHSMSAHLRQTLVDVAGCDAQARSRHLRRVHGL